MGSKEIARLCGEIRASAGALRAQAAEIYELAKRLEELTKDTPAWGTPARGRGWSRKPHSDTP